MKTERNILVAFILNLSFSVFEFIGGTITGSVAIISDSVHDIGDAFSIGVSYFLERKSKRQPDEIYTYGYKRFSVLGSLITTVVLLIGSAIVIYNSVLRLFNPVDVNYNGMIVFALAGTFVNLVAAIVTGHGESLNQKAVNLHMLEDVLGWIVVLTGAVIMRFTDISLIDPIMSVAISVFIFVNAIKNIKEIENLFTEKIPDNIKIEEIKEHICHIDGVEDVHHIHIWSIDGFSNYATMHIVTDGDAHTIKHKVREELAGHNISHVTLELEGADEHCHEKDCHIEHHHGHSHGHHHHHH